MNKSWDLLLSKDLLSTLKELGMSISLILSFFLSPFLLISFSYSFLSSSSNFHEHRSWDPKELFLKQHQCI